MLNLVSSLPLIARFVGVSNTGSASGLLADGTMKTKVILGVLFLFSIFGLPGQETTRLQTRKLSSGHLEFRWRSEARAEIMDGVREFEIQKSSDFRRWDPLGTREAG